MVAREDSTFAWVFCFVLGGHIETGSLYSSGYLRECVVDQASLKLIGILLPLLPAC